MLNINRSRRPSDPVPGHSTLSAKEIVQVLVARIKSQVGFFHAS